MKTINLLKYFLILLLLTGSALIAEFNVEGDMNVQGKLRIQPQGDIGMGVFQVTSGGGNVTDSDSDGLPDSWEMQYFGNLNQNATVDSDGDGVSNLQEYQQGSNPVVSNTAPTTVLLPSTGIFARYSADEAYKDAANTQKCSVSGTDTCASLKDLSGNNRHLLQATGVKQPTWYASLQNGKPGIRFDGRNHTDSVNPGDTMSYRGDAFPVNHAIYFVVKKISVDTAVTNRNLIADLGVNTYLNFNYGALNTLTHNAGSLQVTAPYSNSKYEIMSVSINTAGTSYLTVGSQIQTSSAAPSSTRGGGFDIGGGIYQTYADMDVAEAIIYSVAQDPNTGDGLAVRKYLDGKYNLGLFPTGAQPPSENLFVWYSAEEAYKDAAKTQKCSASGTDTCYVLKDLSNGGHDIVQATTNLQPVWKSGAQNGNPSLTFDGMDDYMDLTSGNLAMDLHYFIVMKQKSWTVNNIICGKYDIPSSGKYIYQADSSPEMRMVGVALNNNGLPLNQFGMAHFAFLNAPKYSYSRIKGNIAVNPATYTLDNGIGFSLGRGGQASGQKANFEFCEVLVYTGDSMESGSAKEKQILQYLNTKWGLGEVIP